MSGIIHVRITCARITSTRSRVSESVRFIIYCALVYFLLIFFIYLFEKKKPLHEVPTSLSNQLIVQRYNNGRFFRCTYILYLINTFKNVARQFFHLHGLRSLNICMQTIIFDIRTVAKILLHREYSLQYICVRFSHPFVRYASKSFVNNVQL